MPVEHARIIRSHRNRIDDGKGYRRYIAGQRSRLSARVEDLWRENEAFCRHVGRAVGWTYLALQAAEHFRRGEPLVPLPPTDEILASYDSREGFGRWDAKIGLIIHLRMGEDAATA